MLYQAELRARKLRISLFIVKTHIIKNSFSSTNYCYAIN